MIRRSLDALDFPSIDTRPDVVGADPVSVSQSVRLSLRPFQPGFSGAATTLLKRPMFSIGEPVSMIFRSSLAN